MTTTTPSIRLRRPRLVFHRPERLALAGFLAGYRGLTRDAYALDLRQFVCLVRAPWAEAVLGPSHRHRALRPGVEEAGRARATVARRLCTVAGFYRYAEEEGLVPTPRQSMSAVPGWTTSPMLSGSTATRWVLSSSPPGSAPPAEHALISLLALNGLRVSEAIGADIEAAWARAGPPHPDRAAEGRQDRDRAAGTAHGSGGRPGHRRTSRPGRSSLSADGERFDRHGAGRIVRRVARRAGIDKP